MIDAIYSEAVFEEKMNQTLFKGLDPHAVAYRYGAKIFGYDPTEQPTPRGMLIGEAPGPQGDSRLPLFCDPPGCAGDRLRRYAGLSPQDYLGRLRRVNMCRELPWSSDRARVQRKLIVDWLKCRDNFLNDIPLRVVLLGNKVARMWDLESADFRCGWIEGVDVVAIPHPSGLNRVYNDPENELRAGRVVQWAAGQQEEP